MIEIVVEQVQLVALTPARRAGDDGVVGLPQSGAQAATPRHAPLCLMVAIVGGRVWAGSQGGGTQDVGTQYFFKSLTPYGSIRP